MTILLDGKRVAAERAERLAEEISRFKGRPPALAVFLIGEDPASQIYVRNKVRACGRVGIRSVLHQLEETISQEALLRQVQAAGQDREIDGILVQMPLPKGIDERAVIDAIPPNKDVDGLHPYNVGCLALGREEGFVSCTPLGIATLLDHYQIDVAGKDIVILGRSPLVGKPLSLLLGKKGVDATVTVVHSRTADPKAHCRRADIVIAAMGVPLFLDGSSVKEGAVVIDVGISKKEGRIVGDVDFEAVFSKVAAITPVPGGVGPMTIAMLLENTMKSYALSHS